jgi:pectate lyase
MPVAKLIAARKPQPERRLRSVALAALSISAALFLFAPAQGQQPAVKNLAGKKAFPGALGYGALAAGGRNGRIIHVTSLADSGAGTLRACIEARGPRVCVFRVNGVIRFTSRPPWIVNPYITIAGQTAPGGGITLSHGGGDNGRTPLVIKDTTDVIIRHVRVRTDRIGGFQGAEDDITIENSTRVIIDHVSGSWARDEVINGFGDNDDVTISNSIFAWGIPKHDKCALLASDPKDKQRMTFVNNICAHNGDRNPDINFPPASCVEVVNNILYNAQSEFAEVWESYGGTPVSIVGNTFVAGGDTNPGSRGIARETTGTRGMAKIYMWDNAFVGSFSHISPEVKAAVVTTSPCPLTAPPRAAAVAYADVLLKSGAFPRDAIDAQVVADVRNRTGRINYPNPAIPRQPTAAPYPDADKDGMDDAWERSQGMNPAAADPWADQDGDGIANFEEFLTFREKSMGL